MLEQRGDTFRGTYEPRPGLDGRARGSELHTAAPLSGGGNKSHLTAVIFCCCSFLSKIGSFCSTIPFFNTWLRLYAWGCTIIYFLICRNALQYFPYDWKYQWRKLKNVPTRKWKTTAQRPLVAICTTRVISMKYKYFKDTFCYRCCFCYHLMSFSITLKPHNVFFTMLLYL